MTNAVTDGSSNGIKVRVTDVKTKRLNELTETDARRDGFESIQDLIEGLKEFYPNITLQDPVTIIGFKVIDASQTKIEDVDHELTEYEDHLP